MKELKRVGQMMSNVLFNLSQDERFTPEERILFKDLQKKWDAAQQSEQPTLLQCDFTDCHEPVHSILCKEHYYESQIS